MKIRILISFLVASTIAICRSMCIFANEERSLLLNPYDIGDIKDRRCEEIRHLDMTYSFAAPATKKAWAERAKYLREQILTGTGLLPMPERTPLNAHIFGRIERGDYSIEKVYFESFPGFYVTGNLFRPLGKKGPFPAVLNTHGHWGDGRLVHREETSIPGRCINFAKQGYIAFAYDMIGFLDSNQTEHRGGKLDGERAHLWGISIGGLQLWNSIRAVDFLLSLPDVAKTRIACTGASGGGTQTFLLTAVDDRVKFSAPVNMISSTMQGGCQCENPPLIRLDTNNMEIGALAAPRPLLLVSATGDWTVKTPTVEFPAIRSVYELLGAEEKVAHVQFDAPHNYNKDSREAVYAWFGRWILGNPNSSDFKERPFEIEKPEDMLVFAKEPRPANALDAKGIIENRILAAKKQLEAIKPRDIESLNQYRKVFGPPFKHCLAIEVPKLSDVMVENRGTFAFGDFKGEKIVLGRKDKGD
ncbi:MAG: acetylxylan esterase, partial [Armatimonadota bacterium]|nr:acetylxylan esterase [Armatimonadota bacterium]